jgi:hypothetical protein
LKAGDADTLGGLPASAYVTEQQLAARGVAAPATTIVAATGGSANAAPTNVGLGMGNGAAETDGVGTASTQSVTQAAVTGTGTAQYLPLWTSGSNLGVSKIYQAAGGFIGINTNTPLLQLDVNGNSIFRGSFQMAPQGTATPSAGQPSHSFQWQASLFDSAKNVAVNEAFGFRTVPDTNNVAGPAAKLDLFYGPGGGTLNDIGLSINQFGVIHFAANQSFLGTQLQILTTSTSDPLITANTDPILATYGTENDFFAGQFAGALGEGWLGVGDVGIGPGALRLIDGGSADTAVGDGSLSDDTSGGTNTAVGYLSAGQTTTGSDNTAVGSNSLAANVVGNGNTAVGSFALAAVNTSFNTAIGDLAGNTDTGQQNTWLGYKADAASGSTVNFSTAIGSNAKVTGNNMMALGGVGHFAVSVGIGTPSPISLLDVEATAATGLQNPNPVITLGNTAGGDLTTVAIDFNPDPVSTSGTYNPDGRFAFSDEGNSAGAFVWYNNVPGAKNNGLQQNMSLDANGNLTVRGNLVKGGGSFKIDDPIDPANKYLSHSFVESPDMMNIYNGIVTLDGHGSAVVTMPEWFSALNRDFRYTLTAIGSPAPKLFIADELHENCFRIAGGKKGQRVSWQITGIRQDAYANAHRIPTEEEKPESEQGHYLHPELFGAGAEKAVGAGASVSASGTEQGVAQTSVGQK